ncbi:hypothetical protein K9N50_12045, partial [bacterium]|nr:hypothetical protein [bacterium]
DKIYKPITELYCYEPDSKVQWIVRDHDDYSNGASYYYDQKIEIWATALDYELRGQHPWLYNVVTHEFTHMVQLGASRKGPRWMPQVYLQYFGYEREKRPDVLYGYPNQIASWPIAGTVVPMWFAEGTAQFQARGLGFEYWDSHRDMMVRTRILENKLLTINEMGVFGKNSLGNETVYCQGFSLVRYIADRWGDKTLKQLTCALNSPFRYWSFDSASRKVLGISARELHKLWQADMYDEYMSRTVLIRENIVNGKVLNNEGFGNFYPTFSPDGKKIAFISNKGKDYLSLGNMYIYDLESDSLIETKCPANRSIDWSPDGKCIAYASRGAPDKHGSEYYDLYLWNIEKEKSVRLTRNARLWSPSFSHDGRQIVAVNNLGGSLNLALVDLPESFDCKDISDSTSYHMLTNYDDGTQVFRPRFSTDDSWIAFGIANLAKTDIYRYDLESGIITELIATEDDERDPAFSSDGKYLYWADDRSSIFNLYRLDLEDMTQTPVTNVIGGAFMPTISADGKIAYAEFTEKGYGLSLIEDVIEVNPRMMTYIDYQKQELPELSAPEPGGGPAKLYANTFGKPMFMPRLFVDKDKIKPGFYFMTSDQLEKLSLFGSAAMSPDLDRDLYLEIQYRVLWPTIYMEVFNIARNHDQSFDDNFVILGEKVINDSVTVPIYDKYAVEYQFNLSEIDVGARFPLPLEGNYNAAIIGRLSNYKSDMHFDDGGTFEYTYHKGDALILRLNSNHLNPTSIMDIHPSGGWTGWVEYAKEHNRFINDFKVDAERGTISEVYTTYNYHRIEADFDYYRKIYKSLVFNSRLMAGAISDSVDSFYNLYAGGLIGMRGYSFYSLGGTRKVVWRNAFRFPILTQIDKRWGPFYFDRLHGAVFTETGNAWTDQTELHNLQMMNDLGAELRLRLFSWYGLPTDLQISGAYGFNQFDIVEDDIRTSYGNEWRFYFTLLFGFL